jgi:hydroxymethylbilane synthase
VLAAAGLLRLNFTSRITAFLSAPVLMYSVGQGSLAIEVRTPPAGATPATDRDARILAMVRSIGDWRATWRAECERALLRELEGGCSIPVGVDTRFSDHDQVEGKRNEGEAERLVAEARGVDAADTIRLDGHTIPADEAGSSRRQGGAAGAPKPPRLERLETGFEEAQAAAASAAAPVAPAPRLPDLSNMYPEYLADEPAEGATLSLHCCVVSLDGKRHCEYKLAALCRSVEDARELGRNVAKELSCARGARVILAEVERHRQLAEAADERRRREGRAARVAEVAGGPTRAAGEELDEREARRKLDEALAAASSGAGLNSKAANGEQQPWGLLANEVDRRGVPREDGQAKAWEV